MVAKVMGVMGRRRWAAIQGLVSFGGEEAVQLGKVDGWRKALAKARTANEALEKKHKDREDNKLAREVAETTAGMRVELNEGDYAQGERWWKDTPENGLIIGLPG